MTAFLGFTLDTACLGGGHPIGLVSYLDQIFCGKPRWCITQYGWSTVSTKPKP
jgi:hypothetical protein